MAVVALEVTHASTGLLQFMDFELPFLRQIKFQTEDERRTQSGALVTTYIGRDYFEWPCRFAIVFSTTLDKLSQIYELQDSFTLRPLAAASPLSTYTAKWSGESFEERFRYAREEALYEMPVLFKELVVGSCDIVS
jgi:hypothetical protein